MHARTDNYQDLELTTRIDEEKGEASETRATQTSPPPPQQGSTCFVLRSLGFYPELSFKKKLLLLLCALLAFYETFEPVERGSNDLLELFTESSGLTHGISRGIASLISLIILVATMRGMGKGLKNLEQYSDRVDHHSAQLLDLKKQVNLQRQETAQLRRRLSETIESSNEKQAKPNTPTSPSLNSESRNEADEMKKSGSRFGHG